MIEVFLQPGEFYFGDRRARIRTVLGSCVAVVLWHPRRLIGGMCHYMLPSRTGRPAGVPDGRYGDEALDAIAYEIRKAGTAPREYDALLFGGGNMFPGIHHGDSLHVGRRNVEAGRRLVGAHGFRCVSEHVEGEGHRNLIFTLGTGHVSLRYQGASRGAETGAEAPIWLDFPLTRGVSRRSGAAARETRSDG